MGVVRNALHTVGKEVKIQEGGAAREDCLYTSKERYREEVGVVGRRLHGGIPSKLHTLSPL